MQDPTQRFSDRVEDYSKYRPGYPVALYAYLCAEAGLHPGDVVADLGSGTGLLSRLFIEHGHRVLAVEPNAAMRAAAEREFAGEENFDSLDGRAEAIPLTDASADFVVAGQAFHWFEPAATMREIRRISRRSGQAALIWNNRDLTNSAFQQAYEELLLKFGTDFTKVDNKRNLTDERIAAFFAPNKMRKASFTHQQTFDRQGLRGRLLSSSYVPTADDSHSQPMLAALDVLFDRYQNNGTVNFAYRTVVYHSSLD